MKLYKDVEISFSEKEFNALREAHILHLSRGGKMELNDFIVYLLTRGAKAMGYEPKEDEK